jgi:hypothetical protein
MPGAKGTTRSNCSIDVWMELSAETEATGKVLASAGSAVRAKGLGKQKGSNVTLKGG